MWSAGRLFAIAACLVATYVLFAVTAMRVALRVREVPVPDLRNHTVAEATAQLQDAGLALTVDQSGRLDPKVPAGRIALQDPGAGAVTRRQRSVRDPVRQRADRRVDGPVDRHPPGRGRLRRWRGPRLLPQQALRI